MVRGYLAAGLYLKQHAVYKITLKLVVPRGSVATTFKGILGLEGPDQVLQTDNWTDKDCYGLYHLR